MKTQKGFRKKALLSSIAMLLVAMVALGAATYAWFTSSTTATASGINVRTVKSSELVISDDSHEWGTVVDYGVSEKVLMPASSANGTAWFETNAVNKTSYAGDGTFTSITNKDNYVIENELNVKNNGQAAVDNVTISFTGLDNKYIRVALVEASDNGEAITGDFTKSVYDSDGETYNAVDSESAANTSITGQNTYKISVGRLESQDAKYYKLFVWFEGQDKDCVDANAGQEVEDITFTVTGSTVSELG